MSTLITAPVARLARSLSVTLSAGGPGREVRSGDLIVENHIDDHHIFPADFIKTAYPEVSPRRRDCVLNRTLIDRTTNQRISNRPPSEYLTDIKNAQTAGLTPLLASHFINGEPDAPVWHDGFSAFLDERRAQLWAAIRDLTGARDDSDLLEEEAA